MIRQFLLPLITGGLFLLTVFYLVGTVVRWIESGEMFLRARMSLKRTIDKLLHETKPKQKPPSGRDENPPYSSTRRPPHWLD